VIDQASKLRALVIESKIPANAGETGLPNPAHLGGSSRIIAVTSGKGGVGKTTLAVNLAVLLAEEGHQVLLVDADLGLANVDVMLGLESKLHIGYLLTSELAPADIAADGPFGVKVISGGSGLKALAEAAGSERRLLLNKLRDYYQEFDYVLVDTSPGIADHVIDFLMDAQEVLLVTTTEPTSLRDAYSALKTIYHRAPHLEISIVVNMAASDGQAAEAVSVINSVASQFIGHGYHRWHRIASDSLVAGAIRSGRPLVSAYPRSAAAISLRRLTRSLAEKEAACAGSVER
jgi:flagellar biosynthesis protein FlhG